MPASGRLRNLGCATSLRPFLMSCFFTGQVLAQLDSLRRWKETAACETHVYILPKQLHEKVATLHLPALGAVLTVFAQEHAVHVRVKVEGSFKSGDYRY